MVFEPQQSGGLPKQFRTAEEVFESAAFSDMMFSILEHVVETSSSPCFAPKDFDIQNLVLNLCLPQGHNMDFAGNFNAQFAQISFSKKDGMQTMGETMIQTQHTQQSFGELEEKQNKTFGSILEVIDQKNAQIRRDNNT